MSKALARNAARLLSVVAIAGGALAATAGAASASTCTTDPIPDPNIGVYACYDLVIQDSDPTKPGAELNTAYFVDVDVYGHARVCLGRVIVGGQVDGIFPQPNLTFDPEPVRFC